MDAHHRITNGPPKEGSRRRAIYDLFHSNPNGVVHINPSDHGYKDYKDIAQDIAFLREKYDMTIASMAQHGLGSRGWKWIP